MKNEESSSGKKPPAKTKYIFVGNREISEITDFDDFMKYLKISGDAVSFFERTRDSWEFHLFPE